MTWYNYDRDAWACVFLGASSFTLQGVSLYEFYSSKNTAEAQYCLIMSDHVWSVWSVWQQSHLSLTSWTHGPNLGPPWSSYCAVHLCMEVAQVWGSANSLQYSTSCTVTFWIWWICERKQWKDVTGLNQHIASTQHIWAHLLSTKEPMHCCNLVEPAPISSSHHQATASTTWSNAAFSGGGKNVNVCQRRLLAVRDNNFCELICVFLVSKIDPLLIPYSDTCSSVAPKSIY